MQILIAFVLGVLALPFGLLLWSVTRRALWLKGIGRKPSGFSGTNSTDGNLHERIDLVESRLKGMQLEWDDTFHKLSKIAGRIARAQQLSVEPTPATAPLTRSQLLAKGREQWPLARR